MPSRLWSRGRKHAKGRREYLQEEGQALRRALHQGTGGREGQVRRSVRREFLRRYILPEFGERNLSEITNQQLISFANGLLMSGGEKRQGLTCSTVAEMLMNRFSSLFAVK